MIKCPDICLTLGGMDCGVDTELSPGVVEGDHPDQPVRLDESVGGEVGCLVTKHGSVFCFHYSAPVHGSVQARLRNGAPPSYGSRNTDTSVVLSFGTGVDKLCSLSVELTLSTIAADPS